MSHETSLRTLAERLGILPSYISQDGSQNRSTSDETRVAILAAMGFDASTEERARAVMAALTEQEAERVAAPVRVARESELRAPDSGGIRFHVPDSWGVRPGERVEYELAIGEEDSGQSGSGEGVSHAGGGRNAGTGVAARLRTGVAEVGEGGTFVVALAPPPPPGYYELRISISVRGRESGAQQRLIVVPERAITPERRGFGIIANLYSVRGARSWGVGDLTDLAELARWSGANGAAFVGMNPLHALRTIGGEVSPYSPVSRMYRNPAYLDVEAIPELAECGEARAILSSDQATAELALLRGSDRVEYERKARLARPILEALHRCFAARRASGSAGSRAGAEPRQRAYDAYLQREGRSLDSFATFTALDEYFDRASGGPLPWQQWPSEYRDPGAGAVAAFAREHEREADFHRWVQFELDRQLGAAAAAGASSGLAIGLYQDLAVASAPYGSDVWTNSNIHAQGVSIGAPPDNYSATGQNWGLTPLDPLRLSEDGYRFWTALVRSALRHAGAVRIDHVLGLFRQFWIPDGMGGSQGAYVRFPTHDLLGILALESATHRAVIVGEDLGTVPREVPGTLREWGILGTRVMLFERERDGTFRPASSYEPLSLTTADTHDLPTLAGFWEGRDVELAAELGRLSGAGAEPAAFSARQNDRRLLAERLIADGALESPDGAFQLADWAPAIAEDAPSPSAPVERADALPDSAELTNAVHRFLCATPAILVGIALDDLAGEVEPINLPGVSAEHFASWTRRMRASLETIESGSGIDAILPCERHLDHTMGS